MLKKFLIISTLYSALNCQSNSNNGILYFPDDDETKSFPYPSIPQNINLSDMRGTTDYERYVDMIIAGGIANLTLSINKALIEKTSYSQNNIVFAPMSIGGKFISKIAFL